ncbi:hypothetical protein C6P40_003929, partial [Pichia californica]
MLQRLGASSTVISCNNLVITFERPWTDTLVQDLQNDSFLKSIYANVVGQEKEKIKNYIIDEETGYLYCKSRLYYVATCDHYWQVKSSNYTWSHIAMDIVSGFTPVMVNGVSYDAVLVTIDLFSSH